MLKRLAEAHPTSVAMLSYQYRMNHEICALSNEVAYGGALKCADESVAHRKLDLPGYPENVSVVDPQPWLVQVVNPDFPVIFIDTDAQRSRAMDGTLVSLERTTGRNGGGSIVNDTEVRIVQTVVSSLLSCGMEASNIGLICPFRAQVRHREGSHFHPFLCVVNVSRTHVKLFFSLFIATTS
jgi:DNA replication ATP-dependent helicase Dna2